MIHSPGRPKIVRILGLKGLLTFRTKYSAQYESHWLISGKVVNVKSLTFHNELLMTVVTPCKAVP